ncbi:ABC transporter ATP-binding protein [Natrialba swarupiae]|uniref:ABC transporter ATP-binding protein n=1 Tax=Natrialba swarupiae TaxID=2448032 RepID=A0A5D5AHF4_9EURY|nr:ABC transporter ATP-binding protein [Natrialba swarupiae]TYT61219.1 ABC transporter ATP-binding protein [Natrialba swarupiae]
MTTSNVPPAVRLEGITKRFGDVVANDDVDFTLEKGSIHAVLGENGSGKTTLMSVLYGLYDQDEGEIVIDGEPRAVESPRDAMAAGVGMIHQHFQLVETMTVLQNIVLGHEPTENGLVDESAARDDVEEICSRYDFDVDEFLDTRVEELDLGAQQRVEIVKSLYRGAEILILDEPTAVLTPQEVESLMAVMNDLRADGRSLIFISHKLDEALGIADDITVLRDGEAIGTVRAEDTDEQELARMMVGREVLFDRLSREAEPGDPALEVEELWMSGDRGRDQVQGVDLTVREGEILGIAGVQGNGQSELVEGITGLRSVDDGSIRLGNEEITDRSRRARIESGIAYIPEDRQTEGLVQEYSLVRNALLGNQTVEPYATGGRIDWSAVKDHAEEIIEEFDVQPPTVENDAESLSGGNQQKFIVGREIGHDPDVMIAAHPTRGVDIGSIEFIHNRLIELREEGLAILVVSSKLEEIQKLSDRIAVMYEGEFVDVVDPERVTEEELGLLMTGGSLEDDVTEETETDTEAQA